MAWSKRQKYLVHLYPALAGLSDAQRRDVLRTVTGYASAANRRLTQRDFDRVMAHYEALLDYRIQEGFVERPPRKKVSNLHYWRDRLRDPGEMTTRQRWKMFELWKMLKEYLPPEQRTLEYLAAIAAKATGQHVNSIFDLQAWQAGLVIEALKDRLAYAVRPHVAS